MRRFGKLVRAVIQSLNRFHVDYAITGAIAASYYGAPRTTIDFDIVAYASAENVRRLIRALRRARIEIDEESLKQATQPDIYNIVRCRDPLSAYAVDVIFQRRRFTKIPGRTLGFKSNYQSPEDLVRMKLRMIRATIPPERAAKDVDDVLAILRNTKVDLRRIWAHSRRDKTVPVLRFILRHDSNEKRKMKLSL